MGGCKKVLATDYEPLALELTRYATDKIENNICISDGTDLPLSERLETRLLDLCALQEQPLPLKSDAADDDNGFDVVVAADIMVCTITVMILLQRNPSFLLLLVLKRNIAYCTQL